MDPYNRVGAFIVRYLLDPFDPRPNLAATMPRLALSRERAEDIAASVA